MIVVVVILVLIALGLGAWAVVGWSRAASLEKDLDAVIDAGVHAAVILDKHGVVERATPSVAQLFGEQISALTHAAELCAQIGWDPEIVGSQSLRSADGELRSVFCATVERVQGGHIGFFLDQTEMFLAQARAEESRVSAEEMKRSAADAVAEAEQALLAAEKVQGKAKEMEAEAAERTARALAEVEAAEHRAEVAAKVALDAEGEIQEVIAGNAAGRASLRALWALELMREERSWRLAGGDQGRPPAPVRRDPGAELEVALRMTLDRLREEVGTPSSLKCEMVDKVSSDVALCSLRICQELVASVARHCDAVDVHVRTDEGDLLAEVVGEGWDDDAEVAAASIYQATAERLGGSFVVAPVANDRLVTTLRIPTDATAAAPRAS